MRYRSIFAIACCISIMTAVSASALDTADSQLTQEIKPIDCTNTHTQTGGGTTQSTLCDDAIAPTADPLTTSNSHPILHGTYDAAHAQRLRVFFNGRWYVLGVDAQLTVSGDRWQLDLSGVNPALAPGSYQLIAEVVTDSNQLLQGTSTVVIVAPPTSPPGTIGGILPATGQSVAVIAVGAVLLIATGIGSIMVIRRRSRRRG